MQVNYDRNCIFAWTILLNQKRCYRHTISVWFSVILSFLSLWAWVPIGLRCNTETEPTQRSSDFIAAFSITMFPGSIHCLHLDVFYSLLFFKVLATWVCRRLRIAVLSWGLKRGVRSDTGCLLFIVSHQRLTSKEASDPFRDPSLLFPQSITTLLLFASSWFTQDE